MPETMLNRLFLLIGLSLVLSAFAPGVVEHAIGLYDEAVASGPYFLPKHAVSLYVVLPLVILGTIVSLIGPGLFLAARYLKSPGFSVWLIGGFGISFLAVSFSVGLAEAFTSQILSGHKFTALLAILNFAAYAVARNELTEQTLQGIDWNRHRHELKAMVILPLLLLICFLPKFIWENLNGDTAHVLFSSKLLLGSMNPYWPEAGGPYASDPGFATSLTNYANAWFLRLFGEVEFSIRALVLVCLPVLFSAFLALIRTGRSFINEARMVVFVGLALFLACFIFIYHAAYDPYRADMATPMAREMLLMICYFGFILFFLRGHRILTALFASLTILVVPSGLPLLGFWIIASVLVLRPMPVQLLAVTIATMAICVLVSVLLPLVLGVLGQPVPGGEFSGGGIVDRLKFVTFHQIHRIAYLLLPVGILPALSLFGFKLQDRVSRALTLVVLMYFGLFYFQAYRILLHHFVPAILIPVIVLWRYDFLHGMAKSRQIIAGLSICLAFAFVLSLPSSFRIHTESRTFGQMLHLVDPIEAKHEEVTRLGQSHHLLELVVEPMQCTGTPYSELYVAPGTIYYYAQRRAEPHDPVHMLMQYNSDRDEYELIVRDAVALEQYRQQRVETSTNNWFYFVPRERLFKCHTPDATQGVINLGAIARKVTDRLVTVVR